jgi:beta-galactosidase
MPSRRDFLTRTSLGTAATLAVTAPAWTASAPGEVMTRRISLDGVWLFRTDPENAGESRGWHHEPSDEQAWRTVKVPHTWQIEPGFEDYAGAAWYRREFDADPAWANGWVRIEFEAIFHSARVWVNGREAGSHLRKGYTAFELDLSPLLRFDGPNRIAVRVDNSFDDRMLPRGRSSDWTNDGGIYRPVWLLAGAKVFIERVDVEAVPDLTSGKASVGISVVLRNAGTAEWKGEVGCSALDEQTGLGALSAPARAAASAAPGETRSIEIPAATIDHAKLWHFDDPNLYRLTAVLSEGGKSRDSYSTTFGVRSFETRAGGFYLNGQRVRLMGVERMAGSNPEYGMAEPEEWLRHDNRDLKELNCVFTRVHWQQDRRLLDQCDRMGILIQTEVPTWGADTFKGMTDEPSPVLMENGLEQLREMIRRDRNHPSIVCWGLCNEIGGQNPPAYKFAERMYQEAKRLDPRRLRSYASNTLQSTPEKDVAGLMDFIEWNEYYESWYGGDPKTMRRNLQLIHEKFPDKAIVISEYGYCACTPERPEGDSRRIEVMREHDRVFREMDFVAGLIFFCYNDYRTHIGDKGTGVMKQRVHGVVDVYGARKTSFAVLRSESSPVDSIVVEGRPGEMKVTVKTRATVPAYELRNYLLRGVLYGQGGIPLERAQAVVPPLRPGGAVSIHLSFREAAPQRIEFDVLRPNGFSALTHVWTA